MGHTEWEDTSCKEPGPHMGAEDQAVSQQPPPWPCPGLTCGHSPSQGLDRSQQSLEAVFALRELICLKDPALLSLEVLGFATKYPDVR